MRNGTSTAAQEGAIPAQLVHEHQFQALLASTTDYLYMVTLEEGIAVATHHGPGCEAVTGYTSNDFRTDPSLWCRMILEEDRPAVLAQVAQIIEGEAPRPLEHRIRNKAGDIRWIRNVFVVQRDPQGRVVSYSGIISDITNRKRAEQLLAMQFAVTLQLANSGSLAEALHRILQAICETFAWDWAAFWALDEKTGLLQWSGICYSLCPDLHDFEEATRSLDFNSGISLPGQAWASGEPIWLSDIGTQPQFLRAAVAERIGFRGACALPIRRRDEIIGIVELFSRKVQPPDPDGLQLLTAVGLQIAQFLEWKWAEEALTTERNLLRTLIDALPDHIYAKDVSGQFLMNNRAHLQGLGVAEPQDALAKSDLDSFPGEVAGRYSSDDEIVLRSGRPLINREEPVTDLTGSQHWMLTTKVPWKDSQGRIIGVIGVSRDITERKHDEEQLRRAYEHLAVSDGSLRVALRELAHEQLQETELQLIQAAKLECIGTLAAGVAHEVKNPLQTILMGLHYLAQNVPATDPEIGVALHDMREAVTRANGIVRGLLELAAETKFDMRAEDLNACLERALDLLRYEFVATHTNVARQLASSLPPVLIDCGKMEQVFINLFLNALQAMCDGGTLTIRTRAAQGDESFALEEAAFRPFKPGDCLAVIEVEDTGPGIPEHLLQRIFDPFFTTKPAGHGTGLGLAVAKKIVDYHGGAIFIRNALPAGVRVSLVLRTAKGESAPADLVA